MKLTGYKMECYVKDGKEVKTVLVMDAATKMEALSKMADSEKFEGGKLLTFEREKFVVDDFDMQNCVDLYNYGSRELAELTGSDPTKYDEVI